ncbi:aspartate--ammonia ligase [Mycoplasma sp. T363T]|uniref:Aspartate--ammonia ligase n=1 Tax=Mycoplasma bradburyae TaxID=2963128 RepID=A0AAW6HRF7_9MOLU|nr:aspartate--ammonia ligase [Mycoplasma bradburyae]MDC4162979.1 aspartate--ammonia ligase [Mycoplasma bradburyae]MDC4181590.1 aspartate--ammonia ligase [Mycoplasma bradburyae]MDC4182316.1 aspartate--ammonia ligase [Mycoplasma bradburyae]MDC4183043.1 aspartate--ammonia ligase [Mycoplasma bradburyae]UTS69987.1 aspartate--ammonia ligase [Mycoplasma bradburyae]
MKKLTLLETELAIKYIKDLFQNALANKLNLVRVSAPLIVSSDSGLNDNLNGWESPVSFKSKTNGVNCQIVQSLAKWKRYSIAKYNIPLHQGLYTDMNAIRMDEVLDETHSMYVDQWDWELRIDENDRNIEFLKSTVNKIYSVIKECQLKINEKYGIFSEKDLLPESIYFITTQELLDLYPDKTPSEREQLICEKEKAVFIMQVGKKLSNNDIHDGRSPDYDDWSLNGDILVYNPKSKKSLELSSMGIRVNKEVLIKQLEESKQTERLELMFHKKLINGELHQTVGGGIGQSRLCYFFLQKDHIGEVQASQWSDDVLEEAKRKGIELL